MRRAALANPFFRLEMKEGSAGILPMRVPPRFDGKRDAALGEFERAVRT